MTCVGLKLDCEMKRFKDVDLLHTWDFKSPLPPALCYTNDKITVANMYAFCERSLVLKLLTVTLVTLSKMNEWAPNVKNKSKVNTSGIVHPWITKICHLRTLVSSQTCISLFCGRRYFEELLLSVELDNSWTTMDSADFKTMYKMYRLFSLGGTNPSILLKLWNYSLSSCR